MDHVLSKLLANIELSIDWNILKYIDCCWMRPGHLRRKMTAPRVMMRRHQERTTERATARPAKVSCWRCQGWIRMSCSARTRNQVAATWRSASRHQTVLQCLTTMWHHDEVTDAVFCNSSLQVSAARAYRAYRTQLNPVEPTCFDFQMFQMFICHHLPLQHECHLPHHHIQGKLLKGVQLYVGDLSCSGRWSDGQQMSAFDPGTHGNLWRCVSGLCHLWLFLGVDETEKTWEYIENILRMDAGFSFLGVRWC